MEFFDQYHIFIIGFFFLSFIFGMAFLTHRDKRWIKHNYKKKDIIALGFGILCYGVTSDQGPPKKHKGFLLVHKGGLLFKARFSNITFDIPARSIQKVYHADSHKGARLYRLAVKIDYLTPKKTMDTIAFKMAYPAQWIKIIGKAFIEKNHDTQ